MEEKSVVVKGISCQGLCWAKPEELSHFQPALAICGGLLWKPLNLHSGAFLIRTVWHAQSHRSFRA
jgi:hypothetical protein